jgi:threonine/homoserine/homoserine lactone efflux protein
LTTTILSAVILGTFAGLAPGPYTTMVAGTALEKGFRAGFVLALTPLVTDIVPMLFSVLVLDRLSGMALTLLGITGGAIVLVVGIRFLRGHGREVSHPLPQDGSSTEDSRPFPVHAHRRQSALAGHVIASTLLNPSPWLFWLVIASPLLLRAWNRGPGEGVLFVALLFATNITTASSLAWLASHGRRVLDPHWQARSLKLVGITLILAGALICWQATVGNFQALIDSQEAIRAAVEEGLSRR